jgi:hypothetical protein
MCRQLSGLRADQLARLRGQVAPQVLGLQYGNFGYPDSPIDFQLCDAACQIGIGLSVADRPEAVTRDCLPIWVPHVLSTAGALTA